MMSKIIKISVKGKTYRVKDCNTIFSSMRGLMFDDIKGKDGALIHANNIWMPFVRRPLKLFFLDEKMKVICNLNAVPMTLNPKTWKVYSCKEAKYCLEVKTE